MIDVALARNPQTRIVALHCSGHAGFDDGEGLDLVCAAISALTGALGLGLTEKVRPPLRLSVGDGLFTVDLRQQEATSEAHFLLDTIGSSLLSLAEHYPGFIRVLPDWCGRAPTSANEGLSYER